MAVWGTTLSCYPLAAEACLLGPGTYGILPLQAEAQVLHCPDNAAMMPRMSDRQVVYHNNMFGPYDGSGKRETPGSGSRERRQVLVGRRVNSPYVPKPWGRVSSLESEV
ncbi:hypothetical protein KUCAC02_007479 [Chaenocephalus aceratus]|uniref:Uncharacterized protein n=1 Tax=Chaenocephalus aceratus TaxID=36190 RepID=A0ACB9X788_CHAAC|nr:hypothetical protein KUCAC02_007479 [Chaenocephalus aceratus]